MSLSQLRGELPSCVWRFSLDTGEVLGYVTGDSPVDVLIRASRVKKLAHRDANQLRFTRLSISEVMRMRNHGQVFQ